MKDSYRVLQGKYQRSLVSIRELTHDVEWFQCENETLIKKQETLVRNIRNLCVDILKKEPGDPYEESWATMDIQKMLSRAQTSYDNQFVSTTEQLKKNLETIEKQNEKKKRMTELILEMQEHRNTILEEDANTIRELLTMIADLTRKLLSGGLISCEAAEAILKEARETAGQSYTEMKDIDLPLAVEVSFKTEEQDNLAETVADTMRTVLLEEKTPARVSNPLKPGPIICLDSKTKEAAHEVLEKDAEENREHIVKEAERLTDPQKLYVRAMGESGYCERKQLLDFIKEQYPCEEKDSRMQAAFFDLVRPTGEEGIVLSTVLCVPGYSRLNLFKLGDLGKEVFRYLYSKEPVEAEMDVLVKNHTSLEHGYGIRQTAQLFSTMSYFTCRNARIEYLTRSKKISVKTGDHTSYIPDIAVYYEKEDRDPIVAYYEYETGACTQMDFFAKCNKMASIHRNLLIIVPNAEAKRVTIEKFKAWRAKVRDGTYQLDHRVELHLSTYGEIKRRKNERAKFPWEYNASVSPSKAKANRKVEDWEEDEEDES